MSPARRRRPRRPGDAALKRIAFAWLAGAALVAALAGCGGGKKEEAPIRAVKVYFLRDHRLQPVIRNVAMTDTLEELALDELKKGPTARERSELQLSSPLTTAEFTPEIGDVKDGVVTLDGEGSIPIGSQHEIDAEIVYTLTQFPAVTAVKDGTDGVDVLRRKDFEDLTPAILVESPLPFQKIKSPLHATGTANTFEATFQYELRDLDGKVVAKHFVTATSGTGTRGTFDFTTPFSFHHPGLGTLVVYELSAEDGSRIHQVEIPVELTR